MLRHIGGALDLRVSSGVKRLATVGAAQGEWTLSEAQLSDSTAFEAFKWARSPSRRANFEAGRDALPSAQETQSDRQPASEQIVHHKTLPNDRQTRSVEDLREPIREDLSQRVAKESSTLETSEKAIGQYRVARASLPTPAFLGKQRPPVDVLAAIEKVKAGCRSKFDETVEVVLRLGTDPRRGDQQVRGAVVLPHGTGKPVRVCVFAQGEAAELAQRLGADLVGSEEIIDKVKEGDIQFDKCLATADMMPHLSRVARVLGPRGLMPNPKLGTLVDAATMPAAVRQMKGGRVEYRADRTANVHAGIGKASFPSEHLYGNFGSFASAILNARPKGVKGSGASGYIQAVHLSSTMGSSVPVTLPSVLAAVQRAKQ